MNKKIVIFGTSDLAEMAHFYFSTDSNYEVVAFTVDAEYLVKPDFCGLPVSPFEEVNVLYPPNNHDFFVAIGYAQLNAFRKSKYLSAKSLGYKMASYISTHANIFHPENIGENCFIAEGVTVEPFVKIGNNVTLRSACRIGHHGVIKDHCYIASHAVISGRTIVNEQCFVGLNATIQGNLNIGERSIIGAGAVIMDNVAPEGVYRAVVTERSPISSVNWRTKK